MKIQQLSPSHAKEICSNFGIGTYQANTLVGEGVLNCNYILETDKGKYFVKSVRQKAKEKIPTIHAIEAWMKENGIPAVAMLDNPGGAFSIEMDDCMYTLYPFVESDNKENYSDADYFTIGSTLAAIHKVGQRVPPVSPRKMPIPEKEKHVSRLTDYKKTILNKEQDNVDEMFLEYIDLKLRTLSEIQAPSIESDTVTHGDYHPGNLLFSGKEIVGICDWEKVEYAPRSYELIRSLLYSCLDVSPKSSLPIKTIQAFLKGYLSSYPMDVSEIKKALELRFYRMVLSVWLEDMYYKQGTDRANHFVKSEMRNIKLFSEGDIAERILALV